jgi:hypothetical protein
LRATSLFELAAELGLDILPEHDGLGIFAAEGDPELDQKAQAVAARFGDNCLRLFGFRAVVKVALIAYASQICSPSRIIKADK